MTFLSVNCEEDRMYCNVQLFFSKIELFFSIAEPEEVDEFEPAHDQ